MKTLFTLALVALLPLAALGQGVAVRSLNGAATNLNIRGGTTSNSLVTANIVASSTNYVDRIFSTNSSTLELLAADGSLLLLGSSSLNLSGAPGGFVGPGQSITALNASQLTSGTVPDARFPAILPAIDGSQLTGISGGSGIPTSLGRGTNTDILNLSYRGGLTSTNAYPIVRATITVPPASAQVWQQIYSSDSNGAPFSFLATAVTNNFDPAVNTASPYSGLSDIQLHYGYNVASAPGYRSDLPITWLRGFESTWFNPFNEPLIEVYDRVTVSNLAWGGNGVGFGYTMGLHSGAVVAGVAGSTIGFNHPNVNASFASFVANSNNEAVLNLNKAQLNFINNTNEWLIMDNANAGLIGTAGSNTLFASGGGLDTIAMFKGANAVSSDLQLWLGGNRAFRFDGTNTVAKGPQYWDYPNSEWRAFNDGRFSLQRSYTIPLSTGIGENNGDYRTIGTLTNITTDVFHSVIVQFDLTFYGIGAMRTIYVGNDANAHTDWQELLPITQARRDDMSRFSIDVRVNNNQKEFRLRRTGATDVGGGSSFQGIVTVWANNAGAIPSYWPMKWITDVSGSGASATVSQIDVSTPMIQSTGKVGINTNSPFAPLHVVGNSVTSGTNQAAYFVGNGSLLTGISGGLANAVDVAGGVRFGTNVFATNIFASFYSGPVDTDLFSGATVTIPEYARIGSGGSPILSLGQVNANRVLFEGAAQNKAVLGSDWKLGFASVASGTANNFRNALDAYLERGGVGTLLANTNLIAKGTATATNGFYTPSGGYTNKTVAWLAGTGSPEGAVVAAIGSMWSRTDGSTDTALYRKETGTGNTGWVAVSAGGSFDLAANHHFTSTSSNDFYGTTLFEGNVYFGPTTQIKDDTGGDSIYVSSHRLIDGAVLSLDWTNRTLNDIAGAEVLNWRNGVEISAANATTLNGTNVNFYGPANIRTNIAEFDFTPNFVAALATRYTNVNRRATLMLGFGNVVAATGTPQATVKIEQNGVGGVVTNTFVFSHTGGVVSSFTNWDNCGKLNPGAIVTVTDTSIGSGASISMAGSLLQLE